MKFFFKVFLPIVLAIVGGVVFFTYSQFNSFKYSTLNKDITSFEIKKGSNIRSVSKNLEAQNIIKPALLFTILATLKKQDTKIKAGEYALKKGMSPDDLLALFTSGKTIQYQTRVPEGSTFKEIVSLIKSDKS